MVIGIGTGVVKTNDPGKAFASLRSKLWSFFQFLVHNYRQFIVSDWKILSCFPERNSLCNDNKHNYVFKNFCCATLGICFYILRYAKGVWRWCITNRKLGSKCLEVHEFDQMKRYNWKSRTFQEVPRERKIYFPKKNLQCHIASWYTVRDCS